MAINQNAESIGSSGYAVRGPVSAAVAVGCCLIEVGGNQLGWSASAVSLVGHTHNVADITDLATALTGLQPLDADLTAIAALSTTAYGRSLLTQANAAAALSTIGAQASLGYTPVNKAGDTMTGTLSGTSFIASSAVVAQNVLADYYLTTQANLSLRTSGVVKCQNVAGNADAPLTASAGTFTAASAASVPLLIKAAASQTGNLTEWSNSSNTLIASMNAYGWFTAQRVDGSEYVAAGTGAQLYYTVGLKLANNCTIDWSSTSTYNGTKDATIVRNAAGQLDVRADSGLRVRNLANGVDAQLSASQGIFSGSVTVGVGSATTSNYRFSGVSDTGPWLVSSTVGSRAYAISTDGAEAVRFGGSGTSRLATFAGAIKTGALQISQGGSDYYATYKATNGTGHMFTDATGVNQFVVDLFYSYPQINTGAGNTQVLNFGCPVSLANAFYLPPKTFATLPSASAQTGARYRITDRSQRECYSDGTNWRFAADDAIVT